MNYSRIMQCLYGEPWAVLPATHETMRRLLAERMQSAIPPDARVYQRQNHFSAQALGLQAPRSAQSRVYRSGQLAYIPIQGVLGKSLSLMEEMCGGYNIDQLARDVSEVMADGSIVNVLFDYDSPGGRIQGVPETAKMIRQLSDMKKTFSFSGNQVASAAYWLYSQSSNRYVTESAVTGAVGVYVYLEDRTKQLEAQGVTPILIKAGTHKGAGLPGNPLSPEEVQMIQDQVDMLYGMMVDDIKAMNPNVEDSVLQGQVFLGRQSIDAKLATASILSLPALVARLSA